MVATNGMLSSTDENIAEPHRMSSMSSMALPPVTSTSALPSMVMMPVCCMPPTTTNRPVKNRMVDHSTPSTISSVSCLPISNIIVALPSAIMQESTPSELWNTKPNTTTTIITTLLTSSAWSLIDLFSSSCMTAAILSGSTMSFLPNMK